MSEEELDVYRTVIPTSVRDELLTLRQENRDMLALLNDHDRRFLVEVGTAAGFTLFGTMFFAAVGAEPMFAIGLAIGGLVGGIWGLAKLSSTPRKY